MLPPATPPPVPTPADAHVPDADDSALKYRGMCEADGLWYACGDADCTGYRSCRTDSSLFGCACDADTADTPPARPPRGRPVNALVVAEFGDGLWPGGYKGAEHIEVPNRMPDDDDDSACGNSDSFCSQYSHLEAPAYNDATIPTWMACNADLPSWTTHNEAISVEYDGSKVTLWYVYSQRVLGNMILLVFFSI